MRFFGIDLAFSTKNGSGICVLEEHGQFVREGHLYSDQDIVELISQEAHTSGNVIVVDAPIICVNEGGQRPCEKLVGKAYGKNHASPHSSNTNNMAGQRGPELLRRLAANFPVRESHDAQRVSPGSWPVVETYPHPGHIELFKLPKILKYKKGKVHDRKVELSRYCNFLKGFSEREPTLAVDTIPSLNLDIFCLKGKGLKQHEDLLDALFCAYTAMYLYHHRSDKTRWHVLKSEDSPDFITIPLDESRRVEGIEP